MLLKMDIHNYLLYNKPYLLAYSLIVMLIAYLLYSHLMLFHSYYAESGSNIF